ncbi:Homospermidine synthase [Methylocella silvestris BL2]|uniref:Homospermidine synthase n=1 Tax=Methylocella silvestris (strain DSM 15510 / CIP 108128 / LMG 27833 / NCIMB 13906 / BL2) TaxID=395965 RepID=B8ENJ2_METSB|nr:saccharopine dehydrogenase C-terminal domain-containing protein [Methylocella silvestris]ACK50123.1 Homospermidine synthase [Methylocella silvestris BL2]
MTQWPVHGAITGPIVLIGFGSIGRGILPLIERHFTFDKSRFTVIDPKDKDRALLDERGIKFIQKPVTRENFVGLLKPLLTEGEGQPFIVNLSVDVSSVAIMRLAHEVGALYVDTVAEPWVGFYTDPRLTLSERSNYALREAVLDLRRAVGPGPTAVSCCGANPGMVSWFVKQALLNVAADCGIDAGEPTTRAHWAELMRQVGVEGIHIAERDTQRSASPKPMGVFVNTWSVEGFISEGLQPAELGWGTFEKHMPPEGKRHAFGPDCAIYLMHPGAGTRVRSWTPTAKAQHGWLITHNEAISIADYFTVREAGEVVYRPTCHYAYRPADDAVLSLDEMAGQQWVPQTKQHILEEDEIVDGIDELGVLLYGHAKNAYWYGSQLSIEETRRIAPYQNATGMQVSSAVLAAMVWSLEHPRAGIVEADELDFRRCLEIQRPYLGPVIGEYTDWTPLKDRGALFSEDLDTESPWQFKNVIVR